MYDLFHRQLHTLGVVERIEKFKPLLSSEDYDILRTSAALHDLGYFLEPQNPYFHAFVGYKHLIQHGMDTLVSDLVLCHSFADKFYDLADNVEAKETITKVLGKYSNNYQFHTLLGMLTYSDRITNVRGQLVTVIQRVADINRRYGKCSIESCVNALVFDDCQKLDSQYKHLFWGSGVSDCD